MVREGRRWEIDTENLDAHECCTLSQMPNRKNTSSLPTLLVAKCDFTFSYFCYISVSFWPYIFIFQVNLDERFPPINARKPVW